MHVLWDFDGVLADSLNECYEITRRVVEQEEATLQEAVGKPLAPYSFDEFKNDRPVCVNARDFFVNYVARRKFGKAIRLNEVDAQYGELLVHLDETYYRTRQRVADEWGKQYAESMAPYSGVLEAVRAIHASGAKQAVMSARDEASIQGWLTHFRIEECMEAVAGTEVSRADRMVKQKQVRLLKKTLGKGAYAFVDDLMHNLEVVYDVDPDIQLFFADWGYGVYAEQKGMIRMDHPNEVMGWIRNPVKKTL